MKESKLSPDLQQMLDEKYPNKSKEFAGYYDDKRKTFTEGYLAGQSSLKQEIRFRFGSSVSEELLNYLDECFEQHTPKEPTLPGRDVKQGTPTDEEIESRAKEIYPPQPGKHWIKTLVNAKISSYCWGAKWVRDTYVSKQEIDLDMLEMEFYTTSNQTFYSEYEAIEKFVNWLKSRPEFKSQLSEEKKG